MAVHHLLQGTDDPYWTLLLSTMILPIVHALKSQSGVCTLQVVIKLAEADVSVNALSTLRFGIAALCFLPAALRGIRSKELRWTALELGMWLFGALHFSPCNDVIRQIYHTQVLSLSTARITCTLCKHELMPEMLLSTLPRWHHHGGDWPLYTLMPQVLDLYFSQSMQADIRCRRLDLNTPQPPGALSLGPSRCWRCRYWWACPAARCPGQLGPPPLLRSQVWTLKALSTSLNIMLGLALTPYNSRCIGTSSK